MNHPDFGKPLPCPVCGEQARSAKLRRMSRMSQEMMTWTFETTVETRYNKDALDYLKSMVAFPAGWVALIGENGRGKTRLLCALANAVIDAGMPVLYITTAEFLSDLQETFDPKNGGESYSKILNAAQGARVVILDEFDRFNPTTWAQTEFFKFVENRYRNAGQFLTCFASNGSLEEFPPYLRSRMQDGRNKVFRIEGPDLRPLLGKD